MLSINGTFRRTLPINSQDSQTKSLLSQVEELLSQFELANSMKFRDELIENAHVLIACFYSLEKSNLSLARKGMCSMLRLKVEEIQELAFDVLKFLLDDDHFIADIHSEQFLNLIELESYMNKAMECLISTNASEKTLSLLLEKYESVLERIYIVSYLKYSKNSSENIKENLEMILNCSKYWLQLVSGKGHPQLERMFQDFNKFVQMALQPISNEICGVLDDLTTYLQFPWIWGNLGNLSYFMGNFKRTVYYFLKMLDFLDKVEMQTQTTLGPDRRKMQYHICKNLVGLYEKFNDLKNVVIFQEKATVLAKNPELKVEQKEQMTLFTNLGNNLMTLKEYVKAKPYFLDGLAIATLLKMSNVEATLLLALGKVDCFLEDYCSSSKHYEAAISIALSLPDKDWKIATLLECYAGVLEVYYLLDEEQKIREIVEAAMKFSEKIDKKQEKRKFYNKLGVIHNNFCQYKNAIDMFTNAKELADDGKFAEYYGLGFVYSRKESYLQSIDFFELALRESEKQSDVRNNGKVFTELGDVYRAQGNYYLAIDFQNKAFEIAQKFDDLWLRVTVLSNFGKIYIVLGEYEKAIGFFNQALKFIEINSLDDKGDKIIIIYEGLAAAFLKKGEFTDAVKMQSQALARAIQMKRTRIAIVIRANLAATNLMMGQHDVGKTLIQEALNLCLSISDKELEVACRINLGVVFTDQKDYEKGMKHFRIALETAETLKHLDKQAQAYYNMGLAYIEMEKFVEAEGCLRQSISLLASLQDSLVENNQSKITIFEEQANVYMRLENVLIVQKKYQEALIISDSRRARALVSKLSKKSSIEDLNFNTIQTLAKTQNTTFIIYTMSPLLEKKSQIGVWVVSPGNEIVWQLLPTDAIEEDVKNVTEFFKNYPFNRSGAACQPFPSIVTLKDIEEVFRGKHEERMAKAKESIYKKLKENLIKWYCAFILPIESHILQKNQTITIIPDNFLSQLPFAAFCDSEEKYLIEKCAILFSPSIQTLMLLDEHSGTSKDALIIGNPTTLISNEKLKFAESEAKQVEELLKKEGKVKILIDKDPAVDLVLNEMPNYRWIHFSCHGIPFEKQEEKSSPHSVFGGLLKLSPDANNPKGYLHAEQILQLNLQANQVFLSACYSGTGKLQKEGSIGLVWTFLAAGVSSVIGTLWPLLDNEATVRLVKTFYEGILNDNLDCNTAAHANLPASVTVSRLNKAEALQRAMIEAIQNNENPYVWGSLFLTGLK